MVLCLFYYCSKVFTCVNTRPWFQVPEVYLSFFVWDQGNSRSGSRIFMRIVHIITCDHRALGLEVSKIMTFKGGPYPTSFPGEDHTITTVHSSLPAVGYHVPT